MKECEPQYHTIYFEVLGNTRIQDKECRHDGVQQCHYTEMFPYAIVEYAYVQHKRADARGVQQDVIHSTVHECTHSYNSIPRCTEIVQHEGVHAGTSSYHMSYSMRARVEITYILSYTARLRQQRNIDWREHITYTLVVSSLDLRYLEGRLCPRGFIFFPRVVLYFPKVPRVGRLLTHD